MELPRLVKNSIYSPEFYRDLLGRPLSFSIKYFYSLALILALIATVIISWNLIPLAQSFLAGIGPQVLDYYPEELVITIKNGEASTNVREPYFLKLPEGLTVNDSKYVVENPEGETDLENFLVIDTATTFTVEGFRSYKTAVLLMKDSAAYYGDSGEIRIQPIKGFPDTTVNKSLISTFIGKVEPFLAFAAPLIVIGAFLMAMVVLSFKLVYLLLGAFLVWSIAGIRKIKMGYGKAYQLGIHAMTLGILLNALTYVFIPTFSVPFFFTIVMCAIAFMNLRPMGPESTLPPQESAAAQQ